MDDINEVLDISQRMKRAQILRRYQGKIERAREIAQRKMAPEKNIKKRAYAAARQVVRKRFAGARGAEYEKLGPSEKMAIDRAIEKKQALIKKIALRLIPKVKQAEQKRLQSFIRGQALVNTGAAEGKKISEEFNVLFAERFEKQDAEVVKADDKNGKSKKTSKNGQYIQFYNMFGEEAENDSPIYKAIVKKAAKSNIDLDILGEVYNRGFNAWNESISVSPQQYAFARVNSYINQGKTYFNEDADLHEAFSNWSFEMKPGDKTKVLEGDHRGKRGVVVSKHDNGAVYKIKHTDGTVMKHHISTLEEPIKEEVEIEEGRAPGTPSIKRYKRPDGTTALKSLDKWGKRKDWRDTEGGLAKAREHAGVDKVTEETEATKTRKKIEAVDRNPPHTEFVKQAEIKTKIIDEQGNCQNDPKKRLSGTDSLVKAYKKDTPGASKDMNESFNIAYAAGIGQTFTAADLGMKINGGYAHHPSVIKEMEDMEEAAKTADKSPVIVPSHTDAFGHTIPAKTVMRKKSKTIVNIGDNPSDGK